MVTDNTNPGCKFEINLDMRPKKTALYLNGMKVTWWFRLRWRINKLLGRGIPQPPTDIYYSG